MAWEWSFSADTELHIMDKIINEISDDRVVRALEFWQYAAGQNDENIENFCLNSGIDSQDYISIMSWEIETMPKGIQRETLWSLVEKLRTCSNGGHSIYLAPDGWVTIPTP